MPAFELIIRADFSSAHALRHYHGATEPLHGHNFRVEIVVRGKRLQNKVKYLTDFIGLQRALDAVIKPMDHTNLTEVPPFTRENPSAENIAVYISGKLRRQWRDRWAKLVSVTVWETEQTAARYLV